MTSENKYIMVNGHMVSQRAMQVVEAIRNYHHELDVEFVPERERAKDQAAYRIIHRPLGGEAYTIFHVKNDDEMDARVLKKLIMGDQTVTGRQHVSELEATEEAAKRVAHQRWLDDLEEKHEMAAALLKTDKTVYKFNKDLIFHADRPGNIAHEKKPKVF